MQNVLYDFFQILVLNKLANEFFVWPCDWLSWLIQEYAFANSKQNANCLIWLDC
jgi:hypothetical protein